MSAWKTTCITLVVLATSQFVSGHKVPRENSCKKTLRQIANSSAFSQKIDLRKSKVRYEVCFDDGDVIHYCPGDEICCTPGDPASKCCPADYPLCVPRGNPEFCCPEGYPKLGGEYCCRADSFCCNEKNCCENEAECCGEQCCEADSFCCNGENCCQAEETCCGEQCCEAGLFCCNSERCCLNEAACCGDGCCTDDAPCCKENNTEACCSKTTMGCCDGYGCVSPCEFQFDAIGCQLSSFSLDAKQSEESVGKTPTLLESLYRILRPDENPDGIVAKNPSAQRTVLSHVNCGSRPSYTSQFISTTASLDVAKYYKEKGEEKGLIGLRICTFHVNKLPQSCQTVDLTTEENRDKYLGNAVCKSFAKASQEVLLQCDVPIPCTVVDPSEKEKKKFKDTRLEP